MQRNIHLSTLILVIFILLLVIFGMWFYYNNPKNHYNNTAENPSNVPTTNTVINISNNISTENSFKLGSHYVQSVETPLDDGADTLDCEISFWEDNTFTSYVGWGCAVSGTYKVSSNNMIECTIDTYWSEFSPKQDTYAKISFIMNNNSEIEILDASEFYKVKLSNLDESGNWILTDEDKDMPLNLKKGIKFNLSK